MARSRGGVYIADEVQPGFGRLGSAWWGFLRHDVEPDLVVLGKPMGNGLPISAVVGRREHMDAFGHQVRYFNTFGGTPVSIAAANAVLDEIENRELIASASVVGSSLKERLSEIAGRDPRLGQVRGEGLFLAVEFVRTGGEKEHTPDAGLTSRVVNGLRAKRVLVSASGRYENVLKLRPPLVFQEHHSDRLLAALDEVLKATASDEAATGRGSGQP
jgi:4-aminobutyrate aminotransferase-like enzyme